MAVTTYAPETRVHHDGRPRREDAGKRTRVVTTRLTEAEYERFVRLAEARGLKITEAAHAAHAALIADMELGA